MSEHCEWYATKVTRSLAPIAHLEKERRPGFWRPGLFTHRLDQVAAAINRRNDREFCVRMADFRPAMTSDNAWRWAANIVPFGQARDYTEAQPVFAAVETDLFTRWNNLFAGCNLEGRIIWYPLVLANHLDDEKIITCVEQTFQAISSYFDVYEPTPIRQASRVEAVVAGVMSNVLLSRK
jgi:hypothetical protein